MKRSLKGMIFSLSAIGVAAWFSAAAVSAADVSLYGVMKGLGYDQTGPGAPAPSGSTPYTVGVFVNATTPGSINSATVTIPGGEMRTLTMSDDGEFGLEEQFASAEAVDSIYGSGIYTFQISTDNDGPKTVAVNLTTATYPNAPYINNWSDSQGIDSTADFALRWGAFVDGTVDDLINVEVWDADGNTAFETELNGTGLTAVIPANTLSAGQTYGGWVNLIRLTFADDTTYPGALGAAVYGAGTELTLVTQSVGGLWGDAVDLGGGWKWLEGVGYFNTNFEPWIYHQEHGWIHPFGTTTADVTFWDSAMGVFWWTSDSVYPSIYRFSDGAWLWYEIGSASPRWFYNFETEQWETH
jgi:hypothetical protein